MTSPGKASSVLALFSSSNLIAAITAFAPSSSTSIVNSPGAATPIFAKRNRKTNGFGDDMNSWYDTVNENATPDKVFWEEMERQRLFNQLGGENKITMESSNMAPTTASTAPYATTSSSSFSSSTTMPKSLDSSRKPPTMDQLRAADATLSEYTLFQVQNNWLNDNLQAYFSQMETLDLEEDLTLDEETRRLEEQLEGLPDGYGEGASWRENDTIEPWEYWGDDDKEVVDLERANVLKVPEPPKGKIPLCLHNLGVASSLRPSH
jgi:hypothetical protein